MVSTEITFELRGNSGVIRIVRAKGNLPLFTVTLARGEEKRIVKKVEKEVLIAWLQSYFKPQKTPSGRMKLEMLRNCK